MEITKEKEIAERIINIINELHPVSLSFFIDETIDI